MREIWCALNYSFASKNKISGAYIDQLIGAFQPTHAHWYRGLLPLLISIYLAILLVSKKVHWGCQPRRPVWASGNRTRQQTWPHVFLIIRATLRWQLPSRALNPLINRQKTEAFHILHWWTVRYRCINRGWYFLQSEFEFSVWWEIDSGSPTWQQVHVLSRLPIDTFQRR